MSDFVSDTVTGIAGGVHDMLNFARELGVGRGLLDQPWETPKKSGFGLSKGALLQVA